MVEVINLFVEAVLNFVYLPFFIGFLKKPKKYSSEDQWFKDNFGIYDVVYVDEDLKRAIENYPKNKKAISDIIDTFNYTFLKKEKNKKKSYDATYKESYETFSNSNSSYSNVYENYKEVSSDSIFNNYISTKSKTYASFYPIKVSKFAYPLTMELEEVIDEVLKSNKKFSVFIYPKQKILDIVIPSESLVIVFEGKRALKLFHDNLAETVRFSENIVKASLIYEHQYGITGELEWMALLDRFPKYILYINFENPTICELLKEYMNLNFERKSKLQNILRKYEKELISIFGSKVEVFIHM